MRELRPYLFQGDVSDLNVLKISNSRALTLAIHVGSTAFVPKDFPTIYLPMQDDSRYEVNNWQQIVRILRLVVDEVRHGGKVLVTCDAGISRSVTFAGMLISAMERRGLMLGYINDRLIDEIRHPAYPPLSQLWENAANAMATWWTP